MFRQKLTLVGALAMLAGCAGVQLPRERLQAPGAVLFNGYANPSANCYHCHNGDASGTIRGPDLTKRVPNLTDDQIKHRIQNGKSIMPAFRDKLSPEEIDLLASWLRETLGTAPHP